jgi:NADH:ubiquinone oxidoreductase subunit 3 (subunit A)
VFNPTTELRDVSEMQHFNLLGAVVLVLEKLRGQTKKERKINVRSLQTGKCPVCRTMTGHPPWRNGYNHRRVNVRTVVGLVTVEYAFVRVLLFILFNIITSVLYALSYILDGIQS